MSLPRLVGTGLYHAVSGILSRPEGVPYLQHVICAVVRAQFGDADYTKPVDVPSGVAVYKKIAKQKGIEPNIVPLQTGGTAIWFGSPTAKNVWFYLPGGGYVRPPVEGHIVFANNVHDEMKAQGKDFAIFLFMYDLAPQAKHPTQLKQAVAALNYLFESTKLQPEDIILGGDSAGANLTLMLLSHITHKYPGVEAPKVGNQTFCATILICPWVNMVNKGPNLERNKDICYVSHGFVGDAAKIWLSETKDDEFTSPMKNDPSWWKDVPSGDIFVSGGEYEYFVDDIDAIVEKLKVHKNVEYVLGKYEVHDQFAVTAVTGGPACETDLATRSFIKARL